MTQPYLTEGRFPSLGLGVDLTGIDPIQVRSTLLAAAARVDTYCAVPLLPQPYSFRGGSITGERKRWDAGDGILTFPERVVYLRHTPIKAVSQLRIYVTNTQYVQFDPSELVLLREVGTVEIVSLAMTASGLFGAFIVPNIGLGRPIVDANYTYGYEFTSIDESLLTIATNVYQAQNQFWDASAVTVKVAGTIVTTGFTIDRNEGTVTFAATPAGVVTASYGYTMPFNIAMATGMIAHDMLTERELHERGLGNIRRLRVGEIEMDRGREPSASSNTLSEIAIPPDAQALLEGFRFSTTR